jgi:amidohydrolase
VQRIFALHCDPRADVGTVGLRTGPITGVRRPHPGAAHRSGGHTARPHLTADLVYARGRVIVDTPAVLSRRVDPRAGLSLVWGRVAAGGAHNAIPQAGEVEGTVRSLDASVWVDAPKVVEEAVRAVTSGYDVTVRVEHTRGVPPVVNEPVSVNVLKHAARVLVAPDCVYEMEQSLGGEDFAWYLERVPGALARIGLRRPGDHSVRDLHQGTFDVDERAIEVGVRLFVGAALLSP